jgi:hypothetical protein
VIGNDIDCTMDDKVLSDWINVLNVNWCESICGILFYVETKSSFVATYSWICWNLSRLCSPC